mmetsp:Transcript_5767/g.16946  ORF Transcript_5767/g.16946 Transcript_5767/m.16946 type:complete len:391 (+) Transcript_5767:330-1502(+)
MRKFCVRSFLFQVVLMLLFLFFHILPRIKHEPARNTKEDSQNSTDLQAARNSLYQRTSSKFLNTKLYTDCETCEAPSLDIRFETGCDDEQMNLRRCWWARSFCCNEEPSIDDRSLCSKLQVKYLREGVITRKSYRENINKNLVSYRHGGDRLDSWISLIIRKYATSPCIIIDVGANVGKNTMAYVKQNLHCDVHAFEPMQNTYETLMNNLKKGGATSKAMEYGRLRVHKLAIGDRSHVVRVQKTPEKSGEGSLLLTGSGKYSFDVRVRALSDLFKDHNGLFTFVKIDAEGFDVQAIRGMEYFLARKRVVSFIWEHHGSIFLKGNIGLAQAEVQYVSSFGYHVYIAGSDEGNLKTLRVDGDHWRRFYEVQGKGVWFAGVIDFFCNNRRSSF